MWLSLRYPRARWTRVNKCPEGICGARADLAEVGEVAIRVRVERLKGGGYLGTSPDVPGLVAEGRSVAEAVEITQGLARKIVESCLEHGDPLPRVFRNKQRPNQEFRVRTQHLAHFVHCFALRVSDHVAVNPERDARVRVAHLLLRDFWIRARVDQQARVAVTQSFVWEGRKITKAAAR